MNIVGELVQKFGLTNNEAKVYSAILALEKPKASEIINYSKVPRTKLYEITRSLEKKGFIEIVPDSIQRFKALPFGTAIQSFIEDREKHLHELKESRQKMEKFINSALKTETSDEPTGRFTVYKAKNIINKKMREIIKNADSSLFMLMDTEDLKYLSFMKSRIKQKKIQTKILTPVTQKSVPIVKRWLPFAVKDFSEISLKLISDENEIIVFQSDNPTALYSEDKKFIELMKSFFEHVWTNSPDAKAKLEEIRTGRPIEELKFVQNQTEYYEVFKDLISTAKSEIFVMTTSKGLVRMYNYVFPLLKKAKQRGCKIKFLMPITEENKDVSKKFSSFVEIRHVPTITVAITEFDGLWTTVSELSYDTLSLKNAENKSIVTNRKDVLHIIKYMYNSLWNKAITAGQRIKELEEGKTPETITVINGMENLFEKSRELSWKTEKDIRIITSELGLERSVNYQLYEIERQKSKSGVKIRVITPITRNNINEVKKYMEFAEIRHEDFIPIRLKMHDMKEAMVAHGGEKGTVVPLVALYSNSKAFVDSMVLYFNNIWEDAVPAEKKIAELESGKLQHETKYMTAEEGFLKSIDMIKKAKNEVLISTSNTSIPSFSNIDIESLKKRGVAIKIIAPLALHNKTAIKNLMKNAKLKHVPTTSLRATVVDGIEAVTVIKKESGIKGSMYSTDVNFINSLSSFFQSLWDDGMDAEMRLQEIEEKKLPEKTRIIVGYQALKEKMEDFDSRVSKTKFIASVIDNSMKTKCIELSARGVKIKLLTEITKENLDRIKACSGYMEIRHYPYGKIMPMYIADEKEGYVAYGNNPVGEEIIGLWSNDAEQVSTMKSTFERLWKDSVPANLAIQKIETGITGKLFLKNPEEIYMKSIEMATRLKKSIDIISTKFSIKQHINTYKDVDMELFNKGVKFRVITEITKDNIEAVKEYMKFSNVRHVELGAQPRLLIIDNKENIIIYNDSTETDLSGEWSDSSESVATSVAMFNKLWNNSISAEERIAELERE